MLTKLKKLPHYALKAAKETRYIDLVRIIKHVKTKHILAALAAYADKRPVAVELRRHSGLQILELFLNLIPYCKKHLINEFFLWEYKGKRFCATYNQFIGLQAEYLANQFDDYYQFDWKNKRVLDIGGFVGDSALYFLEKGARQVIIYEPIPENVFSLYYNLQSYKDKFQVHTKAVAQEEGTVILTSNTPMGSLGFGMEEGYYQVECEGISLSRILAQHTVDIVKLDCEGGEKYLADLSVEAIQAIPYWIVEIHHPDIYRQVVDQFALCGFSKLKDLSLTPLVSLLHFQREEEALLHNSQQSHREH